MRAMVDEGERILVGTGRLREFGRLLHESWELKRALSSKIAPAFVNEIYDTARKAGADGGKLLGAGGGGFMLMFVEPERRSGGRQGARASCCRCRSSSSAAAPRSCCTKPGAATASTHPASAPSSHAAWQSRRVSSRWSPKPQFSSCDGR